MLKIDLEISLDATLGCGQAHRWVYGNGTWTGFISNRPIRLKQLDAGLECHGDVSRDAIHSYFRHEDDIPDIMREISIDGHMSRLVRSCPGMRILRQERWECLATYILATNVNVKRIRSMVETVCNVFGKDLGGRGAFPTPTEILDRQGRIGECRLGFRDKRLICLADAVESGSVDLGLIGDLDYAGCVRELQGIHGVGPKVADCVALFSFDHLCAFPVDVRISKAMENVYGISGSYAEVSRVGRDMFGRFAGYAQELLYHSDHIQAPGLVLR